MLNGTPVSGARKIEQYVHEAELVESFRQSGQTRRGENPSAVSCWGGAAVDQSHGQFQASGCLRSLPEAVA